MEEEREILAKDKQHHRDSCTFSLEIAKQFLTFGVAGVAFVVGMALNSKCAVNSSWYWASGCLVLSVTFGLLYLMSVVAHVNQDKNYDVYTGALKWFAIIQIVAFVCALALLAVITLRTVGTTSNGGNIVKPNVIIQLEQKTVQLTVPDNKKALIKITGNDAEITLVPPP